jgi:hypothetical protein
MYRDFNQEKSGKLIDDGWLAFVSRVGLSNIFGIIIIRYGDSFKQV